MTTLAVIKEGKTPPDRRVPLSPQQCVEVMNSFSNVKVIVESSDIRSFTDDQYRAAGVEVVNDVSSAQILLGVKEVPIPQLIAGKSYLFFSHTIKQQPYNRNLLRAILEKKIRLIDYECLVNPKGLRVLGFGRFAGIVGCYNGFLAYGKRYGLYDLKPAYQCDDKAEMEGELLKVRLPNIKIALTGSGRVAKGAMEILDQLKIKKVGPDAYLNQNFDEPVYTQLFPRHYRQPIDGRPWDLDDFFSNPQDYGSIFNRFTKVTDFYISGHFWNSSAPPFFTKEDMRSKDFNIKVVADVSCDIDGPIGCTIRPSTIEDPIYGYDPQTESEVPFNQENAITVMAVDNLPCELPKDASEFFGKELISNVFDALLENDPENMIAKASIAHNGELTENYSYLKDYVNEN